MLETLIHDYFVENTTDYPVILIPEDRKGEFLGMVAYKSKYGILAVHYVYNLPNILVAPERKLNDNG
jgi:hypothetical protein